MSSLKVISLNLWGGKLLEAAIAFIREESPDVLLLQEVYDSSDMTTSSRYRSLSILQQELQGYVYDYAPTYTSGRLKGKVVRLLVSVTFMAYGALMGAIIVLVAKWLTPSCVKLSGKIQL